MNGIQEVEPDCTLYYLVVMNRKSGTTRRVLIGFKSLQVLQKTTLPASNLFQLQWWFATDMKKVGEYTLLAASQFDRGEKLQHRRCEVHLADKARIQRPKKWRLEYINQCCTCSVYLSRIVTDSTSKHRLHTFNLRRPTWTSCSQPVLSVACFVTQRNAAAVTQSVHD